MVGGSAFLSGFPEPVEPEVSEAFATIHFRTKMVGRIKVWPTSLDYSVSYPQLFKKLDTIGSFTNKYRFFIPLKRPIPGAVPDTVNGTYDILARKFFIFTILQPYARPPLMNQEAKLGIVTFPLQKTYGSGYITDKFPSDPVAILKESWDQISVLTIYFTTNLLEVYKSARYGYAPGFYAYEVKQTFKNTPDVPEDNFPLIRGMSKVEFERMKAKPYVKAACH